ncbi:MAG: sugar phosphate isomerase/epimerase [Anaerolineae bacterium]|nr:sugar phosphate isomerase/epimerase [Anaerolineae bacterium]
MSALPVCASTASFRYCTLQEAAAIIRALGFEAIDLEGASSKHVQRTLVLAGDAGEVKRVRALDMKIVDFSWTFEEFSLKPAVNDPDPTVRASNKEQFRRVIDFCQQIGARSVLVLPGVVYPGQSLAEARKLAAQSFNELLPIALDGGIRLITEAHLGSLFETPQSAVELAMAAPGVGLVLDYAHFICQGYPQAEVDQLAEYTVHVHLRQAKNGMMQMPLGDGTINFALVLDRLREVKYDGYLCVEYVHQNYLGATNVDIVTETIKMRDFLKEHNL